MEVTAPQAVASKDGRTYTITYHLKLSAVNETVREAVLKTDLAGGTWSSDAANGRVSSITKAGTTVTYTYTGHGICIAIDGISAKVFGGRVRWHRTDSTGYSSSAYYSDC